MELKPDTKAALEAWLTPTWDTGHPADEDRFYKFVSQYQRDHGFSIDESDLRDQIKRAAIAKGLPICESQEDLIHESVSTAYKILDFLKATRR